MKRVSPGTYSVEQYPLACTRTEDGKPCHGRPVPGDDRCARHYGKLNSQQSRRRRNLADHWVGKGPVDVKGISAGDEEAMFLGAPIEMDPGVAIMQEIHRSAGHVKWLEYKVRGLNEDDLVWGKLKEITEEGSTEKGSIDTVKREYGAEVSNWYKLYLEERKHLFKVSEAAIRAGIEERRVRLAERGVDALEAAINATLRDLGVDPTTARARQTVGNHLREALGSGADLFGYGAGGEAVRTAQAVVVEAEWVDTEPQRW